MSLLLKILPDTLPAFVRKKILKALFVATAGAFACPEPTLAGLSYDQALQTYALFTREQAEKVLRAGRDVPASKRRLYRNAYPLGEKLRQSLGINSLEAAMALAQILYRALEIDLQGDTQGNVIVKSCYFSQFYSAPVCDLISALDDGLFSGLSGGSRLVFSERLTEGEACCRAKLLARRER